MHFFMRRANYNRDTGATYLYSLFAVVPMPRLLHQSPVPEPEEL